MKSLTKCGGCDIVRLHQNTIMDYYTMYSKCVFFSVKIHALFTYLLLRWMSNSVAVLSDVFLQVHCFGDAPFLFYKLQLFITLKKGDVKNQTQP